MIVHFFVSLQDAQGPGQHVVSELQIVVSYRMFLGPCFSYERATTSHHEREDAASKIQEKDQSRAEVNMF